MSYLPDFQSDVFISYSHIDDQPFGEEQKGWVSEFHRNLEIRIKVLLGRGVDVWRDPKLRGVDVFSTEIERRLCDSALLVSIISPAYVQSEWCSKELETFVQAVEQRQPTSAGNRCRIVKVLKTPVPLQKQMTPLRSVLGYEFYRVDPNTERPREFFLHASPEARSSYWRTLDDVAQDIANLFSYLIGDRKADPEPANTVYVAETTSDLKEKRNSLIRELAAHGYYPIPNKPLPVDSAELVPTMRDGLRQARVSVHCIGARYGVIPEGESRSLIHLQKDVAAEHNGSSGRALIWIPTALAIKEEQQVKFVRDLRADSSLLKNAELIETTFEDLKTYLFDQLRIQPKNDSVPKPGMPAQIYVVCDTQDRSEIEPIRNHLFDAGFEVILPLAEGDPAEIREDHTENLRIADAILIHWGRASEPWFRAKMRDLLQLRAIRGSNSMPVQVVHLSAPATAGKMEFQTKQAAVIRSFEGFDARVLRSLISDIRHRTGVTM
jgi:hypothetical protein